MNRRHAASGALTEADARDGARRRFGNATYYREESRRVSGLTVLDTLVQDVRFAARTLRRAPTFTAVAVLTLAIGIGANTAIFSAVDALVLRPLPFPHPERLLSLSLTARRIADGKERMDIVWSYPKFAGFRDAQHVFSSASVWTESQFTLRSGDDAVRVAGEYVDSRYLTTLDVTPAMGRNFRADEDQLGNGVRVAIISDKLWKSIFNADPSIIGRSFDVDGNPYTIVGVMRPRFAGMSGDALFWMPVASAPRDWGAADPNRHSFFAAGRLAPGVSADQAKTVVHELGTRLDAAYPDQQAHWGALASDIDAARVNPTTRRTLYILLGAVGVVLLIACANVANLFLVRASGRRREIAVRRAVGASRWRLVRQMLVESLTLATLGGIASIAVAAAGVRAFVLLQPTYALGSQSAAGIGAANFGDMRIDLAALGFAAALAIGTGLVFGLVPALQATRPSLTETLKDDGGGRSSRIRGVSSRNLLTVVEIALAVVLLAGSGLLIHSLAMLLGVQPGFAADHVLSLRVNRAPTWSKDSLSTFYDRSIAEVGAIPGVESVAIGDLPPAQGGFAGTSVALRDRAPELPGHELHAGIHYITPGWPTALHVPLRMGRLFSRGDLPNTRKVVLVNETAARTFWPGQDPIGRPISIAEGAFQKDTAYVVGVLGDVKFGSIEDPQVPDVYVSYYQMPFSWRMMLFVRTHGDPASFEKRVRETLRRAAPGFPVYDVRTMDERMKLNMAPTRFSAMLLSTFAAVALLLAMIGTYGVISFTVVQRRREIGVRVALGATSSNVTRLVVGQGIALATVGALGGLAVATIATRLLKSMLFGVAPTDPATLAGIVGVLLLAVLAASWIPARRAAGVPAVQALRGD